MKHKIEERIATSIEKITPNNFNQIKTECLNSNRTVNKSVKQNSFFKPVLVFACTILLFVVGAFGFINLYTNNKITTVISLDVNPSIEISVNSDDKVVKVEANNEDAEKIIGDMDFKGSNLDVAINALVGSLLRNGYLSDVNNSILVNVENVDADKSYDVEQRILLEIENILKSDNIEGSILSHRGKFTAEVEKLAKQYGITNAKALLIQNICSQNETYTFENLVPLSINELNLLVNSNKIELDCDVVGGASDKAYIGEEAALLACLDHLGLKLSELKVIHNKLDYEDGRMIYEVEFVVGNIEYEFDVDALTGKILKTDKDRYDANDYVEVDNANYIGKTKALEIALKDAGVSADKSRVTIDNDNNQVVYEVEFISGNYEYEYEINALSGQIVERDKEYASKEDIYEFDRKVSYDDHDYDDDLDDIYDHDDDLDDIYDYDDDHDDHDDHDDYDDYDDYDDHDD